ncbi:type II toxin-antitoxin system RelE/ParE family toxin [Trueperella pyogenes]|uniref:type II toxin-antitoxin system RelE/ParE family toxin n=1 Tax=Trueperella pyogenes TaxID=1661 RepID=UPI00131EE261|nr:type II toxin-antitoxin system RelE/ParE family toxin [Trueperella pyogenes]
MKLAFSPLAKVDLSNIRDHTEEKWGPCQAELYLRELQTSLESLTDFPLRDRLRKELESACRSLTGSQHVIFYRCEDDAVVVVRILQRHMDIDSRLSDS